MEWHTEEPQLYSSGLNSGTVCFITNESQSGSLSFMNACIKIAITIITLIILLKTINYNIKFPLILQSMIHFVSLFISKTYQNMIVNLLLAVFRQIFEMTDTCIYREIFRFFPTDIEMACTDIYREIHQILRSPKWGITGDKGRDKMGIDLSGPLWRFR